MVLSAGAWVCVLLAFGLFAVPSPDDLSIFRWLGVSFLVLGLGFSVGSLATGGVSVLRIQLAPGELRGRGFAAVGCLAAVPALLAVLGPPVLLGMLAAVGLGMLWSSGPNFVW